MMMRKWWRQLTYLASGAGLKWRLDELREIGLRHEIARVREEIGSAMPDNPLLHGFKAYSQMDEDGIIQAILARIRADRLGGAFFEIGCGDGLENNTHALAVQGYCGFWIDGSVDNIARLRANVPSLAAPASRLKVEQQFVALDNIETIVRDACEHLRTKEPDVFSLDIDGNDWSVLKAALLLFTPKIIVVEYNAKFPPPIRVSISYVKNFHWRYDDYYGASLQSFCDLLTDYRLVCCNIAGTNAFFVRTDLAERFESYPVSLLYQPPRYHLTHVTCGHAPSYKWLESSLCVQAA